jgi:hypothetical protein
MVIVPEGAMKKHNVGSLTLPKPFLIRSDLKLHCSSLARPMTLIMTSNQEIAFHKNNIQQAF